MTTNAKSFEERAASEPTELHKNFAEWLFVQTGVKPDLKTVQLVCSMRMDFQRSEENQKHLADRKKAAADKAAKAKAAKIAKAKETLAKLQAEIAAEEATSTPAEKPAPAKKATAPKPEDKPTVTRSRARKATATASEAPAQPKARAARTRKTAAPKAAAPTA
ncbi:hypothetical protein [Streptomyces sp. NPDC059166]|uniref:hypothetical protein n=1 Tax=Streptomyces sp. NPDC059166 TaxID=3346752 RepID=UPI00369C1817